MTIHKNKIAAHELTESEGQELLSRQKAFFATQVTKDIDFRLKQLRRLKKAIAAYEPQILEALQEDLGKNRLEAYITELAYEYKSIGDTIKGLRRWVRPQKAATPLRMMPAESFIIREPYGTALIIGPFNYPFQLLIEPLIGAIAAGNCAILKPSELTPHVSAVVTAMIQETFEAAYISCVEGAVPTNTVLLHLPVDYIFFTGSPQVGKIVMTAAAKHLTPVTLELGGKSPVIVDESADVKEAAHRIIWGKTMNAGQTCVAPDYVYVHESLRADLLQEMEATIRNFFGSSIEESPDYGRIVNVRHLKRLADMLERDRAYIVSGGSYDEQSCYMEPTLLDITGAHNTAVMEDEIFGPLLPVMGYTDLDQVIGAINSRPKPLALYLFTRNRSIEEKVLHSTSSGGVCINDTISHLANPDLPFGGVGSSGMGSYHGKESFLTFSHSRSVLKKKSFDLTKLLYPPYTEKQWQMLKRIGK